ncbi:MAG: cytochrome c [Neisseria sp.]|nr:cytochrome c [Neisseria sp.]
MRGLLFASVCALILAACGGQAAEGGGQGDISYNRTTAFKNMMPEYMDMRDMLKDEAAFRPEAFKSAAAAFSANAREPFLYFQNDPQGNGDALPDIWLKPGEYREAEKRFFAAVDDLNAKAQSGDLGEIRAAYNETDAACNACHRDFRRAK